MKKLLVAITIVIAGFTANAQGKFNLGVNLALPLGDAGKVSSIGVMPEASYLFDVSDQFKVGPSIAYTHYFGKSLKDIMIQSLKDRNLPTTAIENLDEAKLEEAAKKLGIATTDVSYLPVSVAARFSPTSQFSLGADLGYAVAISDNTEGGFYYRPVVAYNFTDNMALQFSYIGVATGDKDIEIAGKKVGTAEGTNSSAIALGVLFSF